MMSNPHAPDLNARIAAAERELAELKKQQASGVTATGVAADSGTAFRGDHNLVISGKVLGDVIQVYHAAPGKAQLKRR